jgi:general secretion pathway protein L
MIKNYFWDSEMPHKIRSYAIKFGRLLKTVLYFSPANEVFIPRKQLCVSMGMDLLSIAHGTRSFNRIRIMGYETYRFQEGRYPSPETVAAMTSMYCNDAKLVNPQLVLCVPKTWSVIQSTELPSAAKENLPDVVAYELDRITPFGSDDALYDYRILKEEGEKLYIAITAVRRNAIEPYISALADKALPVTQIDTNLAAVSTYLHYVWNEQDLIYIDIGSGTYEGGLLQDGLVVSGCAGSFRGDGTDDFLLADVADNVAPWIDLMKERNISPQLIIHSYNSVEYSPLERQLQIPLQILRDDELIIPGFKGKTTSDNVPLEIIGGVLSSLWTKSKAMNLLSRGRAKSTKAPLTLTIILLTMLLSMVMLSLFIPVYLENQKVTAIDGEISARKEAIKKIEFLRKEYNSLQDEQKAIEDFKQTKPQALKILKELTVILPKSAWLTRVHVSDTSVAIEGYATSATNILPKIEASPYFAKVEFTSPTIRDVSMNADRFVIRMELEGMKKEEQKVKNSEKQ